MASLSIGVETEAATAAEALAQNGVKMRATIARLKERGVAERDLQTQNISVNPQYDYENNRRQPRIIGYSATNTLVVKLRDIEKAGEVLDAAVSDGANRLGGLSFGFSDPESVMNEARKAAVANARAKAELYAKAADVNLGDILQIQDGFAQIPTPQPYMDMRVTGAKAESTPIAAGEKTLTANVTLVYAIR